MQGGDGAAENYFLWREEVLEMPESQSDKCFCFLLFCRKLWKSAVVDETLRIACYRTGNYSSYK